MKCPVCWADKAFVREVPGWKSWLFSGLLLVPMQCRHCFHQFLLPWFMTWGKEITPTPRLRIAPATRPTRLSHAAEHYAAQQAAQATQAEDESSMEAEQLQVPVPSRPKPRRTPVRRADAA
ncbi:MAG: hypothetical protein JW818_12065 [Pirellulales bacterium]|nr:hypothetical protein [Pirellulales bacterium]